MNIGKYTYGTEHIITYDWGKSTVQLKLNKITQK